MRRVQAVGLAGIAAAAAVTLTGCEKPTPGVSVFSGTNSVHTEATCWAFDSNELASGQCAEEILSGQTAEAVPSLEVQPGSTMGISVDPVVAESGWSVVLPDGQIPNITSTYFRLPLPAILDQEIPIRVVAGQEGRPRGVWLLRLVPAQR